MKELTLHPHTRSLLEKVNQRLPHGLLLVGQSGVGVSAAATLLAKGRELTRISPEQNQKNPGSSISVSQVRELYEATRSQFSRDVVVVIDQADMMTHAAQSAFLKLLEEPTPHVQFILAAHDGTKLLPTIHSRLQTITVLPLSDEQTQEYITKLGVTDPQKAAQLAFLGKGRPELMQTLASDEAAFQRAVTVMQDARTTVGGSAYERIVTLQKYASNKADALALVHAMQLIVEHSLSAKPQRKLIDTLEQLLATEENLQRAYSPRLQLLRHAL